jgi:hypothetical protein
MIKGVRGFCGFSRNKFGFGGDLDFGADLCVAEVRELLGFPFEFKDFAFGHFLFFPFLLPLLSGELGEIVFFEFLELRLVGFSHKNALPNAVGLGSGLHDLVVLFFVLFQFLYDGYSHFGLNSL